MRGECGRERYPQNIELCLEEVDHQRWFVINRVEGSPVFCERLFEMGLIIGTELYIEKHAPLGNPMEIVVRGIHLTLRNEDAANVFVTPSDRGRIGRMKNEEYPHHKRGMGLGKGRGRGRHRRRTG